MTFFEAFRTHVVPDLRRLIAGYAEGVGWDVIEFSRACDAVYAEARRRGASQLPHAQLSKLRNWISTVMLTESHKHARLKRRHDCRVDDMTVAGWIMQGVGAL